MITPEIAAKADKLFDEADQFAKEATVNHLAHLAHFQMAKEMAEIADAKRQEGLDLLKSSRTWSPVPWTHSHRV